MATAQVGEGEGGNFMQRATTWPVRVKDYFEDLQNEMRLVTWPSWKQVRATTIVVIVSVFALAAYFMVVDEIVNSAIQKLFTTFAR
ncbi:MAG TPA: preprotein translocase subunit SecE [Bryobacteraceae bacterium]|nr:preprotein translocase subunit SecE [Bryobacteraceae bacterium]